MIIFDYPQLDVIFQWNESKTVNIYHKDDKENCIDTFSFSHEKNKISFNEAKGMILDHIKENYGDIEIYWIDTRESNLNKV